MKRSGIWAARLAVCALAASALIFCGGCSDDGTTSSDGPKVHDGPATDGGGDTTPGHDGVKPDGPTTTPDAAPLTGEVIFTVGSSTKSKTLMRIPTTGGTATAVAGLPADIDLLDLAIQVPYGPSPLHRRALPHPVERGGSTWIQLPGSFGLLGRFAGASSFGLLQISTDGTVTALDTVDEAPADGYQPKIAVTDDGKLALANREVGGKQQVVLVRLDGTTWPGSSPASAVRNITPSAAIDASVAVGTLQVGTTHLFFATYDASSAALWTAPIDASAPAQQVTLPLLAGEAATKISGVSVRSADASTFAYRISRAVGFTGWTDWVVVKQGSTTAVNASNAPTVEEASSTGPFMSSMGPKIGLSSTGAQLAYVSLDGKKMWLAKTDGSVQTELTTSFESAVDTFGGIYWADDDNLLFWAGASSTALGLYHYKVSTQTLKNRAGSTVTAPPSTAATCVRKAAGSPPTASGSTWSWPPRRATTRSRWSI